MKKTFIRNILLNTFIISALFMSLSHTFAADGWTAQVGAGQRNWTAITSDASGTNVYAIDSNYIYKSSDGGNTWSQTSAPQGIWSSITSSADGSKLVAGTYNDYIYTSSDSGSTWIQQTSLGQHQWSSVTSSYDGNKIFAADFNNGNIYNSINTGLNWATTSLSKEYWQSINMSSDGTRLIALTQGQLYNSTDGGVTWATSTFNLSNNINSLSLSSNTQNIALLSNNNIYVSIDNGNTWNEKTISGENNFSKINYSADGTKLIVASSDYCGGCQGGGYIYISSDNGQTWAKQSPEKNNWSSISSSFNESRIFISSQYNYVYSYSNIPTPTVLSNPATVISTSSIVLSGYVNTDHTIHGFEWCDGGNSATNNSCTYNASTTINGTFNLGNYTATITNLTTNHFYHYRAFATNEMGTSYSQDYTVLVNYQEWTEQTGSGIHNWSSIASDASGTKLVAFDTPSYDGSGWNGGYFYTSSDSGITWTKQTAAGQYLYSMEILSSYDGNHIVSLANSLDGSPEYIYISSDNGISWATTSPSASSKNYNSITMSSDGKYLATLSPGIYNGPFTKDYIYTSSDFGNTWTQQTNAGQKAWYSITSSSNGKYLAATAYNDYVYTSSDYGVTWLKQINSNSIEGSIKSDVSGTRLIQTDTSGIYISTDGGNNWAQYSNILSINKFILSSNGLTLIGRGNDNYIYTSNDSGVNWTKQIDAPQTNWSAVTSSASGEHIYAGGNNTNIWSYHNSMPTAQNVRIVEEK